MCLTLLPEVAIVLPMAVPVRKRQVLGGAVRTIRLLKGKKQDDLAQALKVHTGYICRIEKGERQPSLERMVALAKALDVDIDAITYFTVILSLADEVAA